MKKNNIIIFTLLALLSAFFLWLWYYLGLNAIDEPLDLVLSVVWWIAAAVAIVVIAKMERTRRRRVRTVYVGEGAVFNSEIGLMFLDGTIPVEQAIVSILDSLKYGFARKDFPDKEDFEVTYFVRTKKYDAAEKEDETAASEATSEAKMASANAAGADGYRFGAKTWEGDVYVVQTHEEQDFDTPEKLTCIVASLERSVF
ncbi:MAG: hypothetical protein RR360_06610 [Raoultibacter sp.]